MGVQARNSAAGVERSGHRALCCLIGTLLPVRRNHKQQKERKGVFQSEQQPSPDTSDPVRSVRSFALQALTFPTFPHAVEHPRPETSPLKPDPWYVTSIVLQKVEYTVM